MKAPLRISPLFFAARRTLSIDKIDSVESLRMI